MKHDLPPAGHPIRPKPRGAMGAVVLCGIVAALYLAREILLPFAFALTLTFLMTPAVALLERLHAGRVVAVFTTVLVLIAAACGIGWIIANQLVDVANQLPLYRQNIHAKIEAFHLPVTGQIGTAAESVQEIVRELTSPDASSLSAPPPLGKRQKGQADAPPAATSPIPVQVVQPPANGWTKAARLGHAGSCAPGTSWNGAHLHGLHAAEERRLEESSSAAGRARSVEPHDPSARRRLGPRQPIPADAVHGQCGLWNSVWFWSLLGLVYPIQCSGEWSPASCGLCRTWERWLRRRCRSGSHWPFSMDGSGPCLCSRWLRASN